MDCDHNNQWLFEGTFEKNLIGWNSHYLKVLLGMLDRGEAIPLPLWRQRDQDVHRL